MRVLPWLVVFATHFASAHPHYELEVFTDSGANHGCGVSASSGHCGLSNLTVSFVGTGGFTAGPFPLSDGENPTGGVARGNSFKAIFDADVDKVGTLASVNITNETPNGGWIEKVTVRDDGKDGLERTYSGVPVHPNYIETDPKAHFDSFVVVPLAEATQPSESFAVTIVTAGSPRDAGCGAPACNTTALEISFTGLNGTCVCRGRAVRSVKRGGRLGLESARCVVVVYTSRGSSCCCCCSSSSSC